jgi:hypothetical protein
VDNLWWRCWSWVGGKPEFRAGWQQVAYITEWREIVFASKCPSHVWSKSLLPCMTSVQLQYGSVGQTYRLQGLSKCALYQEMFNRMPCNWIETSFVRCCLFNDAVINFRLQNTKWTDGNEYYLEKGFGRKLSVPDLRNPGTWILALVTRGWRKLSWWGFKPGTSQIKVRNM